ncbi:MAG: hypothetical protein AMXMBFR46_14600 [Acidimicrobiia bacterium]
MLLVALPKSASTSLMTTLGVLWSLPASQTTFPAQPWPSRPGFDNIARFHSDARELAAGQAEQFAGSGTLFKQHVVPTDHNLDLLDGQRTVVLIRDARDIVRAYFRADHLREHPPRSAFNGLRREDQWLVRAEEIGLIDELERFAARWEAVPEALLVRFEDLVREPGRCVDAIEDHWDLPRSTRPVTLARERYTRVGALRSRILRWRRASAHRR